MSQFGPSFHTDGRTFYLRELWHAEEFMVDSLTARCPGPMAAIRDQIISPPSLC